MQSTSESTVAEEDLARAHCYALISRLFYAPADADLLTQLARQQSHEPRTGNLDPAADSNSYMSTFRALQDVCRTTDVHAIREEYDELFVGAGKALISPYTSGYAVPHAPDRHLLALRERLIGFGLARRDSVFELEDHVSALCDVMRWLIERGRSIEEQRAFFDEFVYAGVKEFCAAIKTRAPASFHQAVAALALAFIEIEHQAFELHSAE